MKRSIVFVLLTSCGAAPQHVVSASHTTGPTPQHTPIVEIARAAEVHFTTTGIGYYARGSFAPGSTVTIASATCTIEHIAGKPNRTVCAAHASHAEADAEEARFLERMNACFRVTPVALSASALRALEASTTTRPESSASFVTVATTSRTTELVPVAPVITVNVQVADPSKTISRVVEQHDFSSYGADRGGPFPRSGTTLFYAAPMLAGDVRDRPDTRFVVQRYAYPPNAWEPPSNVSVDASKETLTRLATIVMDRESETVQLALVLDRAVLAYAVGDDAAGKHYVGELDAWTAAHPRAFANATQLDMSHTLETLHTLASGGFSAKDPCAK